MVCSNPVHLSHCYNNCTCTSASYYNELGNTDCFEIYWKDYILATGILNIIVIALAIYYRWGYKKQIDDLYHKETNQYKTCPYKYAEWIGPIFGILWCIFLIVILAYTMDQDCDHFEDLNISWLAFAWSNLVISALALVFLINYAWNIHLESY